MQGSTYLKGAALAALLAAGSIAASTVASADVYVTGFSPSYYPYYDNGPVGYGPGYYGQPYGYYGRSYIPEDDQSLSDRVDQP